ncbi:hypothetical protein [Nocardiopsis halotolerans]|uniref:hypothetical protein n=1 Tax=Nocardiopsis halotolerans TaxID=124252 RepID=UPI00034BB8CE|nr:hypothetical protein [Nocardiopsis halotolerans]
MADFYELEITTTEIAAVTFGENASADLGKVTGTAAFSQEEAQVMNPVVVEL